MSVFHCKDLQNTCGEWSFSLNNHFLYIDRPSWLSNRISSPSPWKSWKILYWHAFQRPGVISLVIMNSLKTWKQQSELQQKLKRNLKKRKLPRLKLMKQEKCIDRQQHVPRYSTSFWMILIKSIRFISFLWR